MKQHQLDAIRIVLDLASGNALDPSDNDVRREGLFEEAMKQQNALAVVEELWNKEMNG